jgi:hypothetical protein
MANGTRRARKSYSRSREKASVYNETSSLVEAITGKTPQSAMTQTENGALTRKSTGDAVLNFFSLGGALRSRSDNEIIDLFRKAVEEDANLALKALFYLRDIRGGQGERNTFRVIQKWLAQNMPYYALRNLKSVPEMGRWDDLFVFVGTKMESIAFSYIKEQLDKDIATYLNKEGHLSILAKWLPSENTSSAKTRALATRFRQYLGYSPRDYRTTLADLRGALKIIERDMSAGRWDGIDYEKVPSRASMIYRKAFGRHDPEGYGSYIKAVEKGEKTIHSGTLYPYDLMLKVFANMSDRTIDAQWSALPDYTLGGNALVVSDVSGSMAPPYRRDYLPLATSIGLGLYFAEKNKGIFHNYFMTFSGSPELVEIRGNTLAEKVGNMISVKWQQNTNLQAVFDLILTKAVVNHVPESEMPRKIFIVSDMEFDACSSNRSTNFETIKAKYRASGYEMPVLIFWNVDARNDQSPVKFDERGVMLVSGQSPTIFKSVMNSKTVTPYDLMLEVLMGERYKDIGGMNVV